MIWFSVFVSVLDKGKEGKQGKSPKAMSWSQETSWFIKISCDCDLAGLCYIQWLFLVDIDA